MKAHCSRGHLRASFWVTRGKRGVCVKCETERKNASRHRARLEAKLVAEGRPVASLACECGRRKRATHHEACARCRFLDGEGPRQRDAISYLSEGPATLAEIALGLGYPDSPGGRSNAHYLMLRLIGRGRVTATLADFGQEYVYELTLAGLPAVPATEAVAVSGIDMDESVVEPEAPQAREQASPVAA